MHALVADLSKPTRVERLEDPSLVLVTFQQQQTEWFARIKDLGQVYILTQLLPLLGLVLTTSSAAKLVGPRVSPSAAAPKSDPGGAHDDEGSRWLGRCAAVRRAVSR